MVIHSFIDRLGEEDRYDENQRPMPSEPRNETLPEIPYSVMNRTHGSTSSKIFRVSSMMKDHRVS